MLTLHSGTASVAAGSADPGAQSGRFDPSAVWVRLRGLQRVVSSTLKGWFHSADPGIEVAKRIRLYPHSHTSEFVVTTRLRFPRPDCNTGHGMTPARPFSSNVMRLRFSMASSSNSGS
jgi:hypothetical protein